MKNLIQILKDFDEQFVIKNPDWRVTGYSSQKILCNQLPEPIKAFISSAIQGVLEDVLPPKPENRMLTIGQKDGYIACREQIIKNIKKLTK